MKQVAAIIVTILFLFSTVCAFAESIDISGLSMEELTALDARIHERISELQAEGEAGDDSLDPEIEDSENDNILHRIAGQDDFMVVELTAESFKDFFDFVYIGRCTFYDAFSGDATQYCAECGFVNLAAKEGWHALEASDDFAVQIDISYTIDGETYDWTGAVIKGLSSGWHYYLENSFDSFSINSFEVKRVRGYVIFASDNKAELSDAESEDGFTCASGIKRNSVYVDLGDVGYWSAEIVYQSEEQ